MKPPFSELQRLIRFSIRCLDPFFATMLLYSLVARCRFRRCGGKLRIYPRATIQGHGNIVIGSHFSSMGHLYMYAHENGYVEIGDHCSVNTNVQIGAARGRVRIGNDVLIGPNVVIRAANHGIARDSPIRCQASIAGEIRIEDDVWIGSNAVITAGVTLARGSVVAAGAVVTKSTEPYTIVGGVPARKIGDRV